MHGSEPQTEHRNLLMVQQVAAIHAIDEQIPKDWADDYGVDVDRALERRHALKQRLGQP